MTRGMVLAESWSLSYRTPLMGLKRKTVQVEEPSAGLVRLLQSQVRCPWAAAGKGRPHIRLAPLKIF